MVDIRSGRICGGRHHSGKETALFSPSFPSYLAMFLHQFDLLNFPYHALFEKWLKVAARGCQFRLIVPPIGLAFGVLVGGLLPVAYWFCESIMTMNISPLIIHIMLL